MAILERIELDDQVFSRLVDQAAVRHVSVGEIAAAMLSRAIDDDAREERLMRELELGRRELGVFITDDEINESKRQGRR